MPEIQVALRSLVFAAFAASVLTALASWLVRTRRISPFGALGRTLRAASDPLIRPIEARLVRAGGNPVHAGWWLADRKSTRLNSSHSQISYAVFCLKKKHQARHRIEELERQGGTAALHLVGRKSLLDFRFAKPALASARPHVCDKPTAAPRAAAPAP